MVGWVSVCVMGVCGVLLCVLGQCFYGRLGECVCDGCVWCIAVCVRSVFLW